MAPDLQNLSGTSSLRNRTVLDIEDPGLAGPHGRAVEAVIAAMRKENRLSLEEMADIAYLSPYHFARTFKRVTGISPGEFVSAVCLQRAKELLLTTDLSVSEICLEVGYGSLGTFSTRFRQLVGVSPAHLRRLPEDLAEVFEGERGVAGLVPLSSSRSRVSGSGVSGEIVAPGLEKALIFAGLFAGAIPQRRPTAGTVLTKPGAYHIPDVPDGSYHLMVAALPTTESPTEFLLPGDAVRVGRAEYPILVRDGRTARPVDVVLRPMRATDPPLLVSLPAFLSEQFSLSLVPERAR